MTVPTSTPATAGCGRWGCDCSRTGDDTDCPQRRAKLDGSPSSGGAEFDGTEDINRIDPETGMPCACDGCKSGTNADAAAVDQCGECGEDIPEGADVFVRASGAVLHAECAVEPDDSDNSAE